MYNSIILKIILYTVIMDDLDFDNFDDFGPEEVRYLSHKLL